MQILTESQEEEENPNSSISIQENNVGLPDGPVDKNPPANAGDMGLIPGQEAKVLHASGQLSPCTPTAELTCHS